MTAIRYNPAAGAADAAGTRARAGRARFGERRPRQLHADRHRPPRSPLEATRARAEIVGGACPGRERRRGLVDVADGRRRDRQRRRQQRVPPAHPSAEPCDRTAVLGDLDLVLAGADRLAAEHALAYPRIDLETLDLDVCTMVVVRLGGDDAAVPHHRLVEIEEVFTSFGFFQTAQKLGLLIQWQIREAPAFLHVGFFLHRLATFTHVAG
jgi:hypothetical protein